MGHPPSWGGMRPACPLGQPEWTKGGNCRRKSQTRLPFPTKTVRRTITADFHSVSPGIPAREHVPDAERKIVFDRFHVMRHMNEAVDEVRKKEHKALQRDGQDTLSGTKYLWLFAE